MSIEYLFPKTIDDIIEAHLIIQELKIDNFNFDSIDIINPDEKKLKTKYQKTFNKLSKKIILLNKKYKLNLFQQFNLDELIYILTSIKENKNEIKYDGINKKLFSMYPESAYFKFMKKEEIIKEIIPLSELENQFQIYAMAYIFSSNFRSIQSEESESPFNRTYFSFSGINTKINKKKEIKGLNREYKLNLSLVNDLYIDNTYSEKVLKIKNNNQDLITIFNDSFEISIEINSLEDYFIARKVLNSIYEK